MATFNTFWTAPYAGNFNIEVWSTGNVNALQIYYLNVYRANGGSVVAGVDVLRTQTSQFFKMISLQETTSRLFISNSQGNAAGEISLYPFSAPYLVDFANPVVASDITTTGIAVWNDLTARNYLIIFGWGTANTSTTIGIQSDTYTCLYDTTSTFVDARNTFEPCTGSTGTAPTIPAATTIPTYGDTIYQLVNETDAAGHYLFSPTDQDELTFTLRFRKPTGENVAPNQFNIKLLDSTFTDVNPQPTGFDTTQDIIESENFVFSSSWNATASADFYVQVTQVNANDISSFRVYELLVQRIAPSVTQFVKATDILRNNIAQSASDKLFNLIYISEISTISIRNTIDKTKIKLFPMETTNYLLANYASPLTAAADTPELPTSYGSTFSVKAGWYGV